MHSTKYIVGFVTVLTALVAVVLSVLYSSWLPQSKINEAIFNKRSILGAVKDYIPENPKAMADQSVLDIFNNQVTQLALDMSGNEVSSEQIIQAGYAGGKPENIDMAKEKKKPEADRIFPLYEFNSGKDGKFYIVSIRGNGLWDEIWGNVALEPNFSTIAGATFDHAGETPGLGAEIKDNPSFPAKLKGKEVLNDSGEFVGINVVKNGAGSDPHKIDGISGATVTCVGVGEMLYRGINYYQPYFAKKKSTSGTKLGMLDK